MHACCIRTLLLNVLTLEVVTTPVEAKISPKRPKPREISRKEMSGPVGMRKIWYVFIRSFRRLSFHYYVLIDHFTGSCLVDALRGFH
jgi:hypothetical protein